MTLVPFDERDGVIWLDGDMVPWRNAKIHVLTHGLHYASSIFEGMRAYGGRIFKLTEHNERFAQSAHMLGFELPFATDELDAAARDVLVQLGMSEGYIRPIAWRGAEQLSISAHSTRIHVAIAAWEWAPLFSAEKKQAGIRLATSEWIKPAPNALPSRAKAACNYVTATMARHAAEASGFDDALMLDWRGRLAESTGANLFLVIDGAIHTPPADCFLDGITRRTVMEIAARLGAQAFERSMTPHALLQADEVFITSTALEIVPVSAVDELRFSTGPVTKAIMSAYDKIVRA